MTTKSEPTTVSVVIPAYNAASCVSRAVDSVLRQTFRDFEILVVDDGSTDGTLAVLASYGEQLQVLAKTNGGPASARNYGLSRARGEYIAFLDADDYWAPKKLERQVKLLAERPDVGFCSTATIVKNTADHVVGSWPCHEGVGPFPDILFMQGTVISGSSSGVFVRRHLIIELGGFDEGLRGFEDPDLWIRLSARAPFVCIPEPLTVVVRTPGSVSSNLAIMRQATLSSFQKNRHLLPPHKQGGYWRAACASALTDYAKTVYRAGNRGLAFRWTLEALLRAPLSRGRLALSLLLTMLLRQPL